jgi:hypothetical protein
MDLSIWPEGGGGGEDAGGGRSSAALDEATRRGEEKLLRDDAGAAAAFLLRPNVANVGLVVDNAGFELVCDLALADAIVCARRGAAAAKNGADDGSPVGSDSDPASTSFETPTRVTFHVKGHPTFVSDAMDKDLRGTIYVMQRSENAEIAAMGRRWATHLSTGAWVVRPHDAWAQPQVRTFHTGSRTTPSAW